MATEHANHPQHADSFFMSIRPLLIVGQLSAVMPLKGTTGKSNLTLTFSWKNWQIIYWLIILIATVFFNIVSTISNVSDGIRLDNFGSTMFYTVCILNSIFFLDISRKLPTLCNKITTLEKNLKCYGYPPNIHRHIAIYVITFFSMSLFEHSLLTFLNIKGAIEDTNYRNVTFLEAFYSGRFIVIHDFTGHNDLIAVLVFLINVICTFNWNYLDFFLASISMQISGKFERINATLSKSQNQFTNDKFWKKLNEDYNSLSLLTKQIDGYVSKLVLMSYASNLYHLSLQLLRSLKFQGDGYSKVYFYFSMAYLILRTLSVSLCAAKILEESKLPKNILFSLENACKPAKRMLDQVINDSISLTGKRFFMIDRNFIVAMVGTLITYEVILLQLNSLRYASNRL